MESPVMADAESTASEADDELNVDALETVDALLRRREKHQAQRKRKQVEVETLKRTMHQLASVLARTKETRDTQRRTHALAKAKRGALSWEDVAQVFQDARVACTDENAALQTKVREGKALIRAIEAWIAHDTSLTNSPNAMVRTWRHVSLYADPTLRTLGKEWITQQMYHNAARMFQAHGFPPPPPHHHHGTDDRVETFQDMDVGFNDIDDGGIQYLWRRAYIDPLSLDAFVFGCKYFLCSAMFVDTSNIGMTQSLHEETASTFLHQMVTQGGKGDRVNLVAAVFPVHAHRCILVAQQIHHDESWQHHKDQRDFAVWVDATQIGPSATHVRLIVRRSQRFNGKGKPVSLDEEAKAWGHAVRGGGTSTVQQARFRRHVIHAQEQFVAIADGWVQANQSNE
ncbi:Aste57867_8789 [Aphanomyces stellatus]|uniref:Aste57867_8789 protein n=1 Tax=Aphanomyces stellatus TaxID=120398 RepID=A0A485KL64_9STRA|nr:hypothetical protein As57867_008754 [Aphanomyces stellatus]VFT85675.1 Aste57867_8789 [Aphanomyces stellatus]